jgi:hypothetical protein
MMQPQNPGEPPMRDFEGYVAEVRLRQPARLHSLTAAGSNASEDESRLPPPDLPLITRLDEIELAELIERHIDYVDQDGRSVHLPMPFVRHYLRRFDYGEGGLPRVMAVLTLPLVLFDGTLLSGRGLNHEYETVFRIPVELERLLPSDKQCEDATVFEAIRFLTDEWLCDVATDYAGKCVIIACALTIIERMLLPERPAFFVTAGQTRGGKTTTTNMIAYAVLGVRAPAAAWSAIEEERRKALFAYFCEGVPLLVWDNIPRGTAISCPSIEKALTAQEYSDRILGESKIRVVSAESVQMFTGNNISARGDTATRSLEIRLNVNRPDPENRPFQHSDPFAWTLAHRGKILRALYTLLLGNPRRRPGVHPAPETRFTVWWDLIGAAVEHAAGIAVDYVEGLAADPCPTGPPMRISFQDLFRRAESEDTQTESITIVLERLWRLWPSGFPASNVASYMSNISDETLAFKAALESADDRQRPIPIISSTTLSWRLKALKDRPIGIDDGRTMLVLRYDRHHQGGQFRVEKRAIEA